MTAAPVEHDQAHELLEQLAELAPLCLCCSEPINRFEMFVAWPAAGVVAHFACYYAEAHGLGKAGGAS